MPARITEVRDAAKAKIEAWEGWSPGSDDAVVARYSFDVDSKTHTGRKVYIVPSAADSPESVTRAEDAKDYTLTFMTVEKFKAEDGQGDPPDEWVDERVRFV